MQKTIRNRFAMLALAAFVLVMPLYMAGCSTGNGNLAAAGQYGVNATLLAGTVIQIEPEVEQAEAAIEANIDQFSAEEQAQLRTAQASIQTARDTVGRIITGANGAAQVLVSLSQVQAVYGNAKAAYIAVKPIIEAHVDTFDTGQRQQLQRLDQQAQQLDQAMANLQNTTTADGVNVNQVLQMALSLAATGAKIAIATGV